MTAPVPFAIEYDAALIILHFRGETDGRFAPAAISFQHTPDEPAAFERVLGCAVRINSSWNGLSIPTESWRLPLRRRDPILRRMLESQANHILERLSNRTGVAVDVERALVARVIGGDTEIESVARQLTMSARTLQRRLAEEGVSYQELLDGARKQAAGQYLSESSLAIGEVAYLVGFHSQQRFTARSSDGSDSPPKGVAARVKSHPHHESAREVRNGPPAFKRLRTCSSQKRCGSMRPMSRWSRRRFTRRSLRKRPG